MRRYKPKTKVLVTENIDYFEMLLGKYRDETGNLYLDDSDLTKIKSAYDSAHDIRKFEISLYWQRTTYIWGFVSVLIAGYGYFFTSYFSKEVEDLNKSIFATLMLITSLIGLLFTGSWIKMLQSSKFWQENWELSIAVLEKYITGNLHKIHFHRYENAYERSSVHKIMLALMYRFFTLWAILVIGSMVVFLNEGLNFINIRSPINLDVIKMIIYLLAIIFPVFELIYRFHNYIVNNKDNVISKFLYAVLDPYLWIYGKILIVTTKIRERKLTTKDICIVYDDISVEKEKK